MAAQTHEVERDARAELRDWYLASLQPRLARTARTGAVPPAAAAAFDRELRELLDVRPRVTAT